MGILSDATPYFSFSRLVKVYLYHVLNLLVIGPFAYFVVWLFSGKIYAHNIAFGIQKRMEHFFASQILQYLNFVIPVCLLIYQRLEYGYIKMDLYPIILLTLMGFLRIFIISIRHATTPPRVYRGMFTAAITQESRDEALIY
jgi:hypothetical protein